MSPSRWAFVSSSWGSQSSLELSESFCTPLWVCQGPWPPISSFYLFSNAGLSITFGDSILGIKAAALIRILSLCLPTCTLLSHVVRIGLVASCQGSWFGISRWILEPRSLCYSFLLFPQCEFPYSLIVPLSGSFVVLVEITSTKYQKCVCCNNHPLSVYPRPLKHHRLPLRHHRCRHLVHHWNRPWHHRLCGRHSPATLPHFPLTITPHRRVCQRGNRCLAITHRLSLKRRHAKQPTQGRRNRLQEWCWEAHMRHDSNSNDSRKSSEVRVAITENPNESQSKLTEHAGENFTFGNTIHAAGR